MTKSGLGSVAWWGFSPPINLLPTPEYNNDNAKEKSTLGHSTGGDNNELIPNPEAAANAQHHPIYSNVLLLGSSDPRLIAATVAELLVSSQISLRQSSRKTESLDSLLISEVNFYVYEPCVELYARQILLTSILFHSTNPKPSPATSNSSHVSNDQQLDVEFLAEAYLEVFGDILLSRETASFVRSKIKECLEFVTSLNTTIVNQEEGEGLNKKCPDEFHCLWDLGLLKYKEKDALENTFKRWLKSTVTAEEALEFWDSRVRDHLQESEALFDWDHAMKLPERHLQDYVSRKEYLTFRKSGVSYEPAGTTSSTDADTEDREANPTLLAEAVVGPPGRRTTKLGYWGDICSGPFTSWVALDPPAFQKMSQKVNGRIPYTSHDFMFWNVVACLLQIRHGISTHNLQEELDFKSRKLPDAMKVDLGTKQPQEDSLKFRIVLLPFKNVTYELCKPKFKSKFDNAFVSSSLADLLPKLARSGCLTSKARVTVENVKSIVELNSGQINQYGLTLAALGNQCDLRMISTPNALQDYFFVFQRSSLIVEEEQKEQTGD